MWSFCLKHLLTATILLATCHCDVLTPFRHEDLHHSRYVKRSPFDDADPATILEAPFIWGDITPSAQLIWHQCYHDFECARLEVPMNWNATHLNETVPIALALIKLPAVVPITDPRYGGPILLNPGGPGGSGVGMVLGRAKEIQAIADAAYVNGSETYIPFGGKEGKFFDIVSWDPRAVGKTTPFRTCFSDPAELVRWTADTTAQPGTPEWNMHFMWSTQLALAGGCLTNERLNPKGEHIVDFMSTDNVVRDMVEILERIGEWREAQVNKIHLGSLSNSQNVLGNTNSRETVKALRWRKGEEPLQYWGFSYGTILGATFSTLQPHRVHRVILDGVADSVDYYAGGWTTNLQDSDKVIENFFDYCFQAGPANCSMVRESDTSSEDIMARWDDMEDYIKENGPIPVLGHDGKGPQVITLTDIYSLIFATVYKPHGGFQAIDQVIGPIMNSLDAPSFPNATVAAARKYALEMGNLNDMIIRPLVKCNTTDLNINDPECGTFFDTALWGMTSTLRIHCRDGDNEIALHSITEFENYQAQLSNQSRWLGEAWAGVRFLCSGWPSRPQELGHWFPDRSRRAAPLRKQIGSNATASGILLIGNSYDPVTPVRNARSMSALFKNSVVLQNDVEGHCVPAGVSLCAVKAVRTYFQTGKLPEENLLCLPQIRPLVGENGKGLEKVDYGKLDLENKFLLKNAARFAKVYGVYE